MPKLLAAVSVGILAFAALVGAMAALGALSPDTSDPAAPEPGTKPGAKPGGGTATRTGTTRPPATATSGPDGGAAPTVVVEQAEASWDAAAGTPVLVLRLTLRNDGAAAEAASASWTLELQGERADTGHDTLGVELPPGSTTVQLEVPFGGEDAADWWVDHARSGEQAEVAVTGTLAVRSAGGAANVPFAWERAWDGQLAAAVSSAADCASGGDVCLVEAEATWSGSALEVRLTFQNRGDGSVRLRGDVGLAFGGRTVAAGELDRTFVGSGGAAETEVRLSFSKSALAAWWETHAARCESSPVQLVLDLAADDGVPRGWTVEVPPYTTAIACGGAA